MADTKRYSPAISGKTRLLAFSLFFSVLTASLSAQDAVYRSRISGDQSFASGDYPVAASFYAQYAREARENSDRDALRDAYERQIDALILGKMTDQAAKSLNEYELHYPGVNPLSLSMWKADLKILEKNPKEAIRILERIMPGLTLEDPRRLRALASLANAYEFDKNFFAASDTYQTLRNAAAKTPLEKTAFERKVFSLASTDTPALALTELQNMPYPVSETDLEAMRLLTIYALIRSEGFNNIEAAWNDALKKTKETRNPVFYAVLSAIGDKAAGAGRYHIAQDAYKSAFSHAATKNDAYSTLEKLLALLDLTKEPGEAANLAARSLELFRGPYATPQIKLRIARIFRNAGRVKEAVSLYRNIMNDPAASRSIRRTALLECAYLQNESKQYAEAGQTVRSGLTAPGDQGKAAFVLADLLLRRDEFEKAAKAFDRTARQYPEYREKALYQSALAWFSAKRYPEAVTKADELIQKYPGSPVSAKALYLKGLALEAAGDKEKAKAAFEACAAHSKTELEFAPKALFKAAKLAFALKKPLEAEKIFKQLAEKYPNDPLAPAALYWRIFSSQARGDEIQAERETWLLADRYPNSDHTIAALFDLASHYADSGASVRANSVLDNLMKRIHSGPLKVKILLEKARIANRSGDTDAALRFLAELNLSKPDASTLAEAHYLHADIFRQRNDYEKAIQYYSKVLGHKIDPIVELAALGSIADSLFTLASEKNNPELYREALEKYNLILSKTGIPEPMRVMTLYKSGRCEELLGNDDIAIERYKTAVAHLVPNGASSTSTWAVKAVEALAGIAQKRPLKAHIDAAVAALQKLADSERMETEFVDERILQLEKLKYKP